MSAGTFPNIPNKPFGFQAALEMYWYLGIQTFFFSLCENLKEDVTAFKSDVNIYVQDLQK